MSARARKRAALAPRKLDLQFAKFFSNLRAAMMEKALAKNLVRLALAYQRHEGGKLTKISRFVHGDAEFLSRLTGEAQTRNKKGTASFTVRKYDEAVQWFSNNWPAGLDWPLSVARPRKRRAAPAEADRAQAGAA